MRKPKQGTKDSVPIIDIHCHPSLKTWLFPKNHIYDTFNPSSRKVSAHLFVTIDKMIRGNVKAAVVAHYLPEIELIKGKFKSGLLKEFRKILLKLCKNRDEILVENVSDSLSSFEQIKEFITRFEDDVKDAQRRQYPVAIATDYKEVLRMKREGKTVFIHSIEGAHSLGNGDQISYEKLEENLIWLYRKGICQFTIGHLFPNILVASQGGLPKGLAKKMDYDPAYSFKPGKGYDFPFGYNVRHQIAERLICKMLDIGIIIDLVHCHEKANELVYCINEKRKKPRPLVFSHTGVREIVKKYNPDLDDIYLNYLPDKEDIKKIKDCNGVLGIIFMNFWLFGKEGKRINAIPYILESIQFIRDVTKSNGKGGGTYDHIAIGTDLDGFTEVPPDLLGEDQIVNLIPAMREAGIPEPDINKICSGNYMRVLKDGWGNSNNR